MDVEWPEKLEVIARVAFPHFKAKTGAVPSYRKYLSSILRDREQVYMFPRTRNQPEAEGVPLWNAVFCLDCELISNSRGDECPACKSRSLVSLARMLGGSLLGNKVDGFREWESVLFDVTITVELQQMHAKDLNTTLESLTDLIGPRLGRGRASFHVDVKPTERNSFHRAA